MSEEPREFLIDPSGIPKNDEYTVAHCASLDKNRADYVRVREVTGPDYKAIALELMGALEKQPQIVYETLLEATAFMGIPEKKRESFISDRYENVKFIVDTALASAKKAMG